MSTRAENGSSSSTQMVAETKMLKAEPKEKLVNGITLALKQGTIKGKESMEVGERDEKLAEKKVMEGTERAYEKGMEGPSMSMRDKDGSSSCSTKIVEATKVPKAEPDQEKKVVKTLAEMQCIIKRNDQSTGSDESDGEHDSNKGVPTKLPGCFVSGSMPSKCKNEDETSSSSWMQMVDEVNMLAQDPRREMEKSSAEPQKKVVEGSPLAKEQVIGSSSISECKEERNNAGMKQCTWPSIYRVPDWLKSMTKAEAYRPQVVSLGPFHHGEQSLRPMEEHKRRLMRHMVERSGELQTMFVKAIEDVAEKLQGTYDGLDEEWRGDNTGRFVDVMVTDGGFLLELMTTARSARLGAMTVSEAGYARYDPIFSQHSLFSLWPRFRSDMILVENQVPLLALQKLEEVRSGRSPSDAYAFIIKLVTDFTPRLWPNPVEIKIRKQEELGLHHPLEVFHRKFCGGHSQPLWQQGTTHRVEMSETPMLSAERLREAGVRFRPARNTRSVQDIDFENGVLSMPLVEITDCSERTFLNLMAFEQLHSNAGSVATDYMIFMDNIIDSERDVALLKSKKVLRNFLGSDKAAADLFNTLRKGATVYPGGNVSRVQWQLHVHCRKWWPKLLASFKHTYLRTPWVFFSAVAAIILLAVTILQTVYTVMYAKK